MMEQIENIKFKLRDNKTVKIISDNLETFIKVESYLLKNSYKWNGHRESDPLDSSLHGYAMRRSCIQINYHGSKNMVFYNDDSLLNNSGYDVELNKDTVDEFFDKLFKTKPNYQPKEKSIRML